MDTYLCFVFDAVAAVEDGGAGDGGARGHQDAHHFLEGTTQATAPGFGGGGGAVGFVAAGVEEVSVDDGVGGKGGNIWGTRRRS